MSRKVHPRTVLLLSAARPSINLTFSCKLFYSSFFLCKTDPQSSNYLKNRGGYAFPDYDRFCSPFGNEIPLTINHGREMSTISGNAWIPDFNRYWEQTPFCGQERIKLELYPLLLWIITCFLLKSCLEYPLECTLLALQAQRLSSSFQLLVQRVYFGSLRLLRG